MVMTDVLPLVFAITAMLCMGVLTVMRIAHVTDDQGVSPGRLLLADLTLLAATIEATADTLASAGWPVSDIIALLSRGAVSMGVFALFLSWFLPQRDDDDD